MLARAWLACLRTSLVFFQFIPLGDILGSGERSPIEGPPIPLDDINKLFPMHGSMGPGDGMMDSLLSHILDDLGHGGDSSVSKECFLYEFSI